jgi:Tfp pilus assembly protein PilO
MKRLPPDKLNKLIIVIVATLAAVGMVYYLLIGPQKEENQKLAAETVGQVAKLQQIKTSVKQAEVTANKVNEIAQLLGRAEEDTATGDLFAWTYDTIRQFKGNRHIEIKSIGQPVVSDVDLIAGFPYKQIKFQIMGTGYYHDIGKFVADLENKFPHMRVVNLTMDSGSLTESSSGEKLSFRLEIAALVKPNA